MDNLYIYFYNIIIINTSLFKRNLQMSTKGKIGTIIIGCIDIFLIITIPLSVLLLSFSNYGTIDDSLNRSYYSSFVSPKVELMLYADVDKITVEYDKTPVNYDVKVEVNIKMSGSNMVGKSYL